MNNDVLLIIKCIVLLYKESILEDTTSSRDIIKTVLENIKNPDISFGISGDREILSNLKNIALEMINSTDKEYCKEDLLHTLKISTLSNEKLYKTIEEGILGSDDEKVIKRRVLSIRKTINNQLKESKILEILNAASYAFKFQRNQISDASKFISELIAQLEPMQLEGDAIDAAIISDVDLGNSENVVKIFDDIKNRTSNGKLYKTGWVELNEMLQGGFRPGEFVMLPALQHKYKTGFSLSLFSQIATLNSPLTKDITKKPLMLRISFEDDLELNIQYLYQYLKYNETREPVRTNDVSASEMADYIREKLQVNGFSVKFLRVDPTQWSYRNICSKVVEYESQGYNVEVLMVDYLGMLPTTGCNNTGPMGTDMRDLFRRMRNFCSSKEILMITPHQLSTEAKNLLRNGIPDSEFVKEINEKGYYSGSKQLDQEVDLEITIHLFKHNKETYLSIQRGKHRIPIILDEDEKKYFLLKFPKSMPIPENINDGYHVPMRRLPSRSGSNVSEDLFKL